MQRPPALDARLAPGPAFRYLRAVRLRSAALLWLLLALGGAGSAGCQSRAKTPAEAWTRFAAAVTARDPQRLYAALDLDTRWSLMSVRRAQREAYDILLSNLPEGPARERQLRRFEAGALADSEAGLFATRLTPARWDELGQDLTGAGPPESAGERDAKVTSKTGRSWKLHRGDDGGWGFAGFGAEAEEEKRRASADLDLVRANAADYERAAARAGK